MADRTLVYQNEVPFTVDILQSQKNYYEALSAFMSTILGTSTGLNELACVPSSPPALTVDVEPGQIYIMAQTDPTAYGDIPADTTQILKQGILAAATTLNTPAPATPGDSIKYLIQFAYSQVDGVPVNRTFYAAASSVVDTQRQDLCVVDVKAGTPAPTGTEVTPTPDAGYVGGWVVTVANGQATVTSGDIAEYPGAPFITDKFQDFLTEAQADARYVKLPTLNVAQYAFDAYETTTPILPPGTHIIVFNSVPHNIATWYNPANGRLTPTIPCVMQLNCSLSYNSGLGTAGLRLRGLKNGTDEFFTQGGLINASDPAYQSSASGLCWFNGTTDFAEIILITEGVNIQLDATCVFSGFVIAN